jgi:aryl-alcohol dehydrogenase-like predicted oxidoreductase
VQSEYSIFSRDIEVDVIPACLEVGASLVVPEAVISGDGRRPGGSASRTKPG